MFHHIWPLCLGLRVWVGVYELVCARACVRACLACLACLSAAFLQPFGFSIPAPLLARCDAALVAIGAKTSRPTCARSEVEFGRIRVFWESEGVSGLSDSDRFVSERPGPSRVGRSRFGRCPADIGPPELETRFGPKKSNEQRLSAVYFRTMERPRPGLHPRGNRRPSTCGVGTALFRASSASDIHQRFGQRYGRDIAATRKRHGSHVAAASQRHRSGNDSMAAMWERHAP